MDTQIQSECLSSEIWKWLSIKNKVYEGYVDPYERYAEWISVSSNTQISPKTLVTFEIDFWRMVNKKISEECVGVVEYMLESKSL